ncbi:MAG: alanine racemase [Brevinematales bacterium]|nr:alanine racemase [Brevinematales bacterium]
MFVTDSFRSTWVEVNLSFLRHNLSRIREHIGGKSVMAVVKADAYGHGAVEIAKFLEKENVNFFAVATLDEAIELREHGITSDILILGPVEERGMKELLVHDLVSTVISDSYARLLNEKAKMFGKSLRVHVKIDTGMGRLGIRYDEAKAILEEIAGWEGLRVEGMFSHFPSADVDREFSEEQIRRCVEVREYLPPYRRDAFFLHIANSEALWNVPSSYKDPFTHVRPGLSLYGVSSTSKELLPLMVFKTRIVQIKRLRRGETVSYLRQYTVQREREAIAVLPVGYADGVPTLGSGKYEVVIEGKRYPQVGRVCMDYMMVSLGESPGTLQEGTEVEIFGHSLPIGEFAAKSGRIPYEVMCGVSKRVPRVYKGA